MATKFTTDTPINVTRTSATIHCEIEFAYTNKKRERLLAISDITPDGVKLDSEMYNYKEGEVSGGKYTAYFTAEIYDLPVGAETLVGLECTYYIETWVKDTDTEYYFYADDELFDGYGSKASAAYIYLREKNKGRVMYPTAEDDYDVSTTYNGEKVYLFSEEVDASHWETTSDTINTEFYIYTRPALFYFKGDNTLAQGDKYLVSDISSLLKNIYKFDNIATQWKRWKNQKAYLDTSEHCSSFKQGNILTAKAMNKAHTYLETGKSYNSGDKISAEMFTILENKLNN